MPFILSEYTLIDAGVFIGSLMVNDARHGEARPLVEAARQGKLRACTTVGILSEVYAALTWHQAQPPHDPTQAAAAVRLLIEPPSQIYVIGNDLEKTIRMLDLAASHKLRARRIHDARHAAAALTEGIASVFTYDADDWELFEIEGLIIKGPTSTLVRLNR